MSSNCNLVKYALVYQNSFGFLLQLVAGLVVIFMASRQKVSVSIDSELLAFIDQKTHNRSEVINEALAQWRKQKLQAEIDEAYAQAASHQPEPDWAEENWLLNEEALKAEGID
ncbi:MAG: hypothetical protein QNJ41_15165 [Xenococcaceae cyanobacterium MO_188.B32]|nr:hypothetical protein [Xenococcaceae cyanobacterium MO_188.B32]